VRPYHLTEQQVKGCHCVVGRVRNNDKIYPHGHVKVLKIPHLDGAFFAGVDTAGEFTWRAP